MMKDLRFTFLGTNKKNRTPSPSNIRIRLINFEKKVFFINCCMYRQKGQDLKKLLERAQQGFAYEMLALEIELDEKQSEDTVNMDSLSQLLQLYMIGVECLESKSDVRYKYFNNKIQYLMKKKVILDEMNRTSKKKLDSDLLLEARKKELGERKEDYDVHMYLSNEQINKQKVKEIVDIAESKLKRFGDKIQSNIKTQDKELEERIRRRKMRSQAGSVQKFKMYKGQVVDRNLVGQKSDGYFQTSINLKTGFKEDNKQKHRHPKSYQFI